MHLWRKINVLYTVFSKGLSLVAGTNNGLRQWKRTIATIDLNSFNLKPSTSFVNLENRCNYKNIKQYELLFEAKDCHAPEMTLLIVVSELAIMIECGWPKRPTSQVHKCNLFDRNRVFFFTLIFIILFLFLLKHSIAKKHFLNLYLA